MMNDVTKLPVHRRAKLGLGYLPQEASIFRGLTVEQNVMSVVELHERNGARRREIVEGLLAELRVDHLRDSPATALSGGAVAWGRKSRPAPKRKIPCDRSP